MSYVDGSIEDAAPEQGSVTVLGAPAEAKPASTSRFPIACALIALIAFAVRLVLQQFEPSPPYLADERWYTGVAHNLLIGRGFSNPYYPFMLVKTALHGPFTVFLLLPAELVSPNGLVLERATMAVTGALTVLAVGWLGRELGGPRVGVIAAAVAAVYPGLWVNDMVATSDSPAALLTVALVLVCVRYRRRPSVRRVVEMGLLAGLMALDRGELAVLAAVLVVLVVASAHRAALASARQPIERLVLAAVVAAALIAPWIVYNAGRFKHLVLISNDLGQTLIGANCTRSYYGSLTGFDAASCPGKVRVPAGADESTRNSLLTHAAVHYALAHWERWPLVAFMRELWLWSLWRPGWTVHMSGVLIGHPRWMVWTQIAAFWLIVPVAAYGAVIARRRGVRAAPLVVLVGYTAVLGLVVVGHLRFRVYAEIALVIFAAVGVDELVRRHGGLRPPDGSAPPRVERPSALERDGVA